MLFELMKRFITLLKIACTLKCLLAADIATILILIKNLINSLNSANVLSNYILNSVFLLNSERIQMNEIFATVQMFELRYLIYLINFVPHLKSIYLMRYRLLVEFTFIAFNTKLTIILGRNQLQ